METKQYISHQHNTFVVAISVKMEDCEIGSFFDLQSKDNVHHYTCFLSSSSDLYITNNP